MFKIVKPNKIKMIKKYPLGLLLLIIVSTLMGCTKDDDSTNNSIPSELIGKWSIMERYNKTEARWVNHNQGEIIWEFENDGSFSEEYNMSNGNGVRTGGKFSVVGNKLEVVQEIYTISELTNSNMKLGDAEGQPIYVLKKD